MAARNIPIGWAPCSKPSMKARTCGSSGERAFRACASTSAVQEPSSDADGNSPLINSQAVSR